MSLTRRKFLRNAAAFAAFCGALPRGIALATAEETKPFGPIIDTHQHLWDLDKLRLPWLTGAAEILRRTYTNDDYEKVTKAYDIRAIYMEVDVDPTQHEEEATYVLDLCQSNAVPTKAAVIGGRPASEDFHEYIKRFATNGFVKGVRQVLHGESTPPGFCLHADFVRGIHQLGEVDWSFDLCMRPSELADGIRLAELSPETRFVLDHCGNADPQAFRRTPSGQPTHDPDLWKGHIERLAKLSNVICKISGIVARAPQGWAADDLAPIVNHCLDAFGPDRVVFGGDWPVCLLGAQLPEWIEALRQIVASRPAADQAKLWHVNAERFYKLEKKN